MAQPVIVAMDVGGSSVKSGLVDPDWLRHPPEPFPADQVKASDTPVQTEAAASVVSEALATIIRTEMTNAGDHPILGVGFGFPSPFDYKKGICLIDHIYKYQALYGMDVGAALRNELGLPDLAIAFRNDAEAAIVAEATFGAGRPYRRVIGLTLGTGLGSSFVVDGVRVADGPGVPARSEGFLLPRAVPGCHGRRHFLDARSAQAAASGRSLDCQRRERRRTCCRQPGAGCRLCRLGHRTSARFWPAMRSTSDRKRS